MKASEIRAVLSKYYALPEWCLMFEVANAVSTGSKRYADALAMCLMPARGLALHGFEIKVSRQDLKTELAEMDKADAIGRYCDHWWLVTPQGLCSLDELPLNWGLLEIKGDKLSEIKPAKLMEPKAYDRAFVAALARRIGQLDTAIISDLVHAQLAPAKRKLETMTTQFETEYAKRLKSELVNYERLKTEVAMFERISGLRISNQWEARECGQAAAVIKKLGIFNTHAQLSQLKAQLQNAIDKIEEVEDSFHAQSRTDQKAG